MSREICVVTGIFPPESGGPAKFALTFSKWLVAKKEPVSVLTLTDGPTITYELNGFMVKRITRDLKLPLRYLKTIMEIRRISKSGKILLVNGCFLETAFAHMGSKRKYIAKVPGDIVWERARNNGRTTLDINDFQKNALGFRYWIFRLLFTYSLQKAEKVIVPSYELRDLCVSWGIPETKLIVIFNSVSSELFHSMPEQTKKFDVISVGRLVTWKGNVELIEACASLKLSLAIAGSGPELQLLKELALKNKANVTFLGDVQTASLCAMYNSAKIYVLNSSYEGTSHSLLEARACGLITIARANVGSNNYVIDHLIDGFLIGPHNGIDLIGALALATRLGINTDSVTKLAMKNTISRFGTDSIFGEIHRVLKVYSHD
jgi:glycosyltransferase involved in cell wall biosynthesis